LKHLLADLARRITPAKHRPFSNVNFRCSERITVPAQAFIAQCCRF